MNIIWRKFNPLAQGQAKKQVLKLSGKSPGKVAKKKDEEEIKKPKKKPMNERRIERVDLFKRERHKKEDYEGPETEEEESEPEEIVDGYDENLKAAQKAATMLSAWGINSDPDEDDDIDDASKAEILAEFLSQLGNQMKETPQDASPQAKSNAGQFAQPVSPLPDIHPKTQSPVNQTKILPKASSPVGLSGRNFPFTPANNRANVAARPELKPQTNTAKIPAADNVNAVKTDPLQGMKKVENLQAVKPQINTPEPVAKFPAPVSTIVPNPAGSSLLSSLGVTDLSLEQDSENQIIFADDLLKSIEERENRAMQVARQRIGNQTSFADFKPETIELLSEKNSSLFAPSVEESCREDFLEYLGAEELKDPSAARSGGLEEWSRMVENKLVLATVASVPTTEGITMALMS